MQAHYRAPSADALKEASRSPHPERRSTSAHADRSSIRFEGSATTRNTSQRLSGTTRIFVAFEASSCGCRIKCTQLNCSLCIPLDIWTLFVQCTVFDFIVEGVDMCRHRHPQFGTSAFKRFRDVSLDAIPCGLFKVLKANWHHSSCVSNWGSYMGKGWKRTTRQYVAIKSHSMRASHL